MQCLPYLSQLNGDKLNNVRRESSKRFKTKKMEYLKYKINELKTNSKNMSITDLRRAAD
jgi:hypothetical protein